MKSNPLVSVIMPIYRVENYIAKSVESVINQTYKNIELILVDDGSPDKSVEIAEKVLKESSFPYKLVKQENLGLSTARNEGIKNSTGEWVMFLDSDDIILPDTIKHLVDAAGNNPDLAFSSYKVICSQTEIDKNIEKGNLIILTPDLLQNGFLTRKYVVLATGTLFSRKMLVDNGLLFEKIPWSEDQHFIWQVLTVIKSAVFLDEPLYQYLKRPGSIMTSSQIQDVVKSYPAICKLPELYNNNSLVKQFLVSRWVLGTISSTAKITDYKNWLLLYKKINGKQHMKNLLCFPVFKIKIRAITCLISKKVYFNFFAKRT